MKPVSHEFRVEESLWSLAVTVFVALVFLSGGISLPQQGVLLAQTSASLVVLTWALVRLAIHGFPTRLSVWGTGIAMASLGLILLQLLPLPPFVWQHFPVRELVLRNFELLGEVPSWNALSLSPSATLADGIALLPALAAFMALLTVRYQTLLWMCGSLICCAIIGVGFALLQHFHGADSGYYLYDSAGGIGVGTFNNRNFFAAQLYTSIPILSAFAVAIQKRLGIWPVLVVLGGVVYAGIILVGLSLSASRTGILLAMPAILFAVMLAYSRSSGQQRFSAGTFGLLAVIFGFLVVGQSSMVGLLRLVQSDPLTDYRAVISKNSLDLAYRLLPAGGGFGTFVPLYQLGETPETLRPEYVNHAHNDWLELVIEGGIPAIILLLAFAVWLLAAELRVWRYGQGGQTALFQRMASLVVPLLLLHSFVDFPLRTPALLTLFAACCGILCLKPEIIRSRHTHQPKVSPQPKFAVPGEKQPFRRPQSGFGAVKTPPADEGPVQ